MFTTSKAVCLLSVISLAEMAHVRYMYTSKSDHPQASGYVYENGASKTFFQLGDSPSHQYQVAHHNSAPTSKIQAETNPKTAAEPAKETAAGDAYSSHHNQMSHGLKPVVEHVDEAARAPEAAVVPYHGTPIVAVPQTNYQNKDDAKTGPQVFNNNGYNYEASKHNSNGEKDSSGYKSIKNYDNESSKKSNNFDKKSFYNKDGGHTTEDFDESDAFKNYGNSYDYKKINEFGSNKSHNKGHKTSGFHNVYHKDEYKKEHLFYDDEDDKGFYKKSGDKSYKHYGDEGSKKHRGHSDSAHGQSSFGKKGSSDKGGDFNKETGYENKYGADSFYDNRQSFGKKAADFGQRGKY